MGFPQNQKSYMDKMLQSEILALTEGFMFFCKTGKQHVIQPVKRIEILHSIKYRESMILETTKTLILLQNEIFHTYIFKVGKEFGYLVLIQKDFRMLRPGTMLHNSNSQQMKRSEILAYLVMELFTSRRQHESTNYDLRLRMEKSFSNK